MHNKLVQYVNPAITAAITVYLKAKTTALIATILLAKIELY